MATDDLHQHINSKTDFYDLLNVSPQASESELRRAYRKTALKYHPDKVGPANKAALEKFHLLQIAYDVLSDATVKELYDSARRGREEKREREAAFEGRRRWMKEDLERREAGVGKRKLDESGEEEAFERELRRLAEDGRKRRKIREEALSREAVAQEQEGEMESNPRVTGAPTGEVDEFDRSVTLRFVKSDSTSHLTAEKLIFLFSRFGPVSDIILRDKKLKPTASKHRQLYTTVVVLFKSVVGAHAAVSDFPRVVQEDERFAVFEAVGWANGREPDFVPKPAPLSSNSNAEHTLNSAEPRTPTSRPHLDVPGSAPMPKTAPLMNGAGDGLKRVPSFSSFKGTLEGKLQQAGKGVPSLDELTMMRLKNAEKRRLEEKIRREEEAASVQREDNGLGGEG